MTRLRLFIAVLAAALLAATVPAPTQAAGTGCVDVGRYTVCRTDPRGVGKDASIVREIAAEIDRARSGDTVRAAVYQWSLRRGVRPVADAMVRAERRGVDVKVVLGTAGFDPDLNDPVKRLFKREGIAVEQCRAACLPNPHGERKGPDHNRFFLVERDGRPTVITTSFSFTPFHLTQGHNLLAVRGDRGLYDYYSSYWQRLYQGSWKGWNEKDKAGSGDHRTRVWLFPRLADPVAAQLRHITGCDAGDRVWVAHANFQPNRPEVREQLRRVQRLGCQVRTVVLDKDSNDPGWIERATGPGSVRVHGDHRNKFLLVQAEFNGANRNLVWTGTHNLSGNSLKNADDNLLRAGGGAVVGVYADYFMKLWRGAR
ncbi:phospholipase D-like domain-containing protein [Glycomyces salinus]|uniref:phospholipase D-like domain-containing protein n=1 Tax=Glycomyces salinus TaxID=980294 RepID=UPI0018EAC176|nr:phospholipase D-like domain-containing protein [Glycomyces salinus]